MFLCSRQLRGLEEDPGLLVGLASSSPPDQIEQVLQGIGIRDQFRAIASGSEVPRSKPDPAVYRHAAERLGVPVEQALAVEDSLPGAQSAVVISELSV